MRRVFAVDTTAYAVTDRQLHLLLHCRASTTAGWSDEEVVRRWLGAFGMTHGGKSSPALCQKLARNRVRTTEWRQRLGSVSWFMRHLNETLARMANVEDGVSGAFWKGRFKNRVLDEAGAAAAKNALPGGGLVPKKSTHKVILPSTTRNPAGRRDQQESNKKHTAPSRTANTPRQALSKKSRQQLMARMQAGGDLAQLANEFRISRAMLLYYARKCGRPSDVNSKRLTEKEQAKVARILATSLPSAHGFSLLGPTNNEKWTTTRVHQLAENLVGRPLYRKTFDQLIEAWFPQGIPENPRAKAAKKSKSK